MAWTHAEKMMVRRLVAGAAMGVVLIPFATAWSGPGQTKLPGDGMTKPGDCTQSDYKALDETAGRLCRVKRICENVTDCATLTQNIAFFQACIDARQALMDKCFRGGDFAHKKVVEAEEVGKKACIDKLASCPLKACPR